MHKLNLSFTYCLPGMVEHTRDARSHIATDKLPGRRNIAKTPRDRIVLQSMIFSLEIVLLFDIFLFRSRGYNED